MNANKEFAISDRRRLQNRMAQRRYRRTWKPLIC